MTTYEKLMATEAKRIAYGNLLREFSSKTYSENSGFAYATGSYESMLSYALSMLTKKDAELVLCTVRNTLAKE